jgi:hypothetical protein
MVHQAGDAAGQGQGAEEANNGKESSIHFIDL